MLQISQVFTLRVRIFKQSALSLLTYCPGCQRTALYIFSAIQYVSTYKFQRTFPAYCLHPTIYRHIQATKLITNLQLFAFCLAEMCWCVLKTTVVLF